MTRYAFITGASRGIGKAAALLLAANGYYVFINCRKSAVELEQVKLEIETAGGECRILLGDVGCPEDVRTMFARIYEVCECLDVLINNAGISHMGLLSDMSDLEWNRVIQTNLSSVFYCMRAAIPAMVKRKGGQIINISSIWGSSGASCEAAYSASKAGVDGLTKATAKELAPSNIQVNAIAYGVIDTTMNGQLSDEERTSLEEEIPAGRFAGEKEAAEMIWNIISAPGYMTGQIIGFNGGFN